MIYLITFLCFLLNAQPQENLLHLRIINIVDSNEVIGSDDSNKQYRIILNKTIPSNDSLKKKKATEYIRKKVFGKKVYVLIENKKKDMIDGSIIYNCEELKPDSFNNNDIPCSSANFLDFELIKKGYIIYVGDNEFLTRLGKEGN